MISNAHCLSQEMPELKEVVHEMKASNAHFAKILERYEAVNAKVADAESNLKPSSDEHLEELKKQRLQFKDELVKMIDENGHVSG